MSEPRVNREHHQDPPSTGSDRQFTTSLQNSVVKHCKSYQRWLMKGGVFDFKKDKAAEPFQIDDCLIDIDVLLKGTEKEVGRIKNKLIFEKSTKRPPPQTVLLYGVSGAGKSTLLKQYAYCWSKDFLSGRTDKEYMKWKLVVYIPASSMKRRRNSSRASLEDIWESIRSELCCPDDDKTIIMKSLKDGEGVLIFFDAIDEIRDEEIVAQLENFVKKFHREGGLQIMLAARTGLCNIDTKYFDRIAELEGYTVEQGKEYVQMYFNNVYFDQPHFKEKVTQYINKHEKALMPILVNPLQVHLFSGLTGEGLLPLSDEDVVSSIGLLLGLENFFIKREIGDNFVSPEEKQSFYQLCIHGILTDVREFTVDQFKEFNISPDMPLVASLNRRIAKDEGGESVTYFSFSHEMMYEFYAARSIETTSKSNQKLILLSVCSRKLLRNVQRLIFGLICRNKSYIHKGEQIKSMVRASLLLSDESNSQVSKRIQEKVLGKMNKSSEIQSTTLLHGQPPAQAEAIAEIWNDVNRTFDEEAGMLRSSGWFIDFLDFRHIHDGILHHLAECLEECSSEMQESVAGDTINLLLPSEKVLGPNKYHTVYAVSGTRWTQVHESAESELTCLEIDAFSPQDVQQGLRQHAQTRHHDEEVINCASVLMNCGNHNLIFVNPKQDQWAENQWSGLLQEVTHWRFRAHDLTIILDIPTPLAGLLDALCRMDTRSLAVDRVLVRLETIDTVSLHQYYSSYKLFRTPLVLQDLTIVSPQTGTSVEVDKSMRMLTFGPIFTQGMLFSIKNPMWKYVAEYTPS